MWGLGGAAALGLGATAGYGLGDKITDSLGTSALADMSKLPRATPKTLKAIKEHMGLPDIPVLTDHYGRTAFVDLSVLPGEKADDHDGTKAVERIDLDKYISALARNLRKEGLPPEEAKSEAIRQFTASARQHGGIVTVHPDGPRAPSFAHELGHAGQKRDMGEGWYSHESSKKFLSSINRHAMPVLSSLAGAGVGLATGSPLYGTLAGVGTGLIGGGLTGWPTLSDEDDAWRRSQPAVDAVGGLDEGQSALARGAARKAVGGYASYMLAPGIIGGAAAGLLGAGVRNVSDSLPVKSGAVDTAISPLEVLRGLAARPSPSVIDGVESKSTALKQLLKAKKLSDARDYKGKHAILREMMAKRPQDFIVDSDQGSIVGITHVPTNFRIHATRNTVPGDVLATYKKKPAEGIPDRGVYGDHSSLKPGELYDWSVQKHKALRAGEHEDLRIGNQDLGLLSWAVRKGLPLPGQKHLAVRQPTHEHSYGSFEGEIPSGYGAGSVKKLHGGQVLVTKVGPDEVHFTEGQSRYPSRYLLKQMKDKDWLLINTTKTEAIPHAKQRYVKVPAEKAEEVLAQLQPGSSVQAKLDGAASLTRLYKDHAEVASYRAAKGGPLPGSPIIHTERMAHGKIPLDVPKDLRGTVLRGELYGINQEGRAIPPQELGGLLNSGVAKSITSQRDRGVELKNMLFDIDHGKNEDKPPYADRLARLKEIMKLLPANKFHGPEEATTPSAALKLWRRIQSGKHPLTNEGIVIHPPTGKPMKAKLLDEQNAYIRETFPGMGKYQGVGAGGFRYSLTPDGPILGEVGTGLSDELRRQMHAEPSAYIGRVARVRSQGSYPSGALRAPSLIALSEDEPAAKVGG